MTVEMHREARVVPSLHAYFKEMPLVLLWDNIFEREAITAKKLMIK